MTRVIYVTEDSTSMYLHLKTGTTEDRRDRESLEASSWFRPSITAIELPLGVLYPPPPPSLVYIHYE